MHEPNWLMALGLVAIAAIWWFCHAFVLFECACIMAILQPHRPA